MAPPKYTPNRNELQRWIDEGLTHQQMADRVFAMTGHRVTRAAVSVAISTYGLSRRNPSYKRWIPWRVKTDHQKAYPVRMLRLLGKRQYGNELGPKDARALDSWLATLQRERLIVAYDRDSDQGLHYIDERFRDHQDASLPIRIRPIRGSDDCQQDCA